MDNKNGLNFIYPLILFLLSACGGGSSSSSSPDQTSEAGVTGDGQLTTQLEEIRVESGVPALAAFIIKGEDTLEMAAVGRRSQNADVEVTLEDRWHLGSITKSMTATLAGTLVDEGLIRWDSTIEEIFPEWHGTILPKYLTLELQQLLSMTSGLEDDFHHPIFETLDFEQNEVDQRYQGSSLAMSYDHENTIGDFLYANTNYVIAGAMLEKVTQQAWPALLQQKVFALLHITEFGFGPPGHVDELDQPLGHESDGGQYLPVFLDNRPILDPAGRVHITLEDMVTYARFHLQGLRGEGTQLTEDTYTNLYTSRSDGNYALGWGVSESTISHSGSNTLWYADLVIDAESNTAIFAVTNAGNENASRAVKAAMLLLSDRLADTSK